MSIKSCPSAHYCVLYVLSPSSWGVDQSACLCKKIISRNVLWCLVCHYGRHCVCTFVHIYIDINAS